MRSTNLGELEVSAPEIEVHVLGPGFGESIVVVIGRRIVLGIDACSPLARRRNGAVYLRSIIQRLEGPAVITWVVSHFHFDHFNGMARVLACLGEMPQSVQRLVLPGSHTSVDIVRLIAADAFETASSTGDYYMAGDEYARVRAGLAREPFAQACLYPSNRFEILRARLIAPGGIAVELAVEGHAPHPVDADRQLVRALREASAGSENRHAANRDCTVVMVSCGRFSGLFLGDVPTERSENLALGLAGELDEGVSFLKVAHHGAEDGTSEELLESIRGRRLDTGHNRPTAVIAPFKAHNLPEQPVITMLDSAGFDVHVCGASERIDDDARREISQDYHYACEIEVLGMEKERDSVFVKRYVFA